MLNTTKTEAPIEIETVASARSRREFVTFPFARYQGDPLWVPPLIEERLTTLFDHLGEKDIVIRDSGADKALEARREAIEDSLYGLGEPVTDNAIDAVASRLRRKLEQAGMVGALHTIRGLGYMIRDPAP